MKILGLYCGAIAMSSCLLLHAQDDAGLQENSLYDEPLVETYQITYSNDFEEDNLFIQEDLGDLNRHVFESDSPDLYYFDDEEDTLIDGYVENDDLDSFEGEYVGEDDLYLKEYYYADQIEVIDSSDDDLKYSENIEDASTVLSSDEFGFYTFTEQEEEIGYYDNLQVDRTSQITEDNTVEVAEDRTNYHNRYNSRYNVGDFFLDVAASALATIILGY